LHFKWLRTVLPGIPAPKVQYSNLGDVIGLEPDGSIEDLGGTTTILTYNADDQLCWTYVGSSSNACSSAPTGSTTYSFDANGNQTTSSAGQSLSYNPINQTSSMTPAGGSALAMAYTGVDSTQRTSVGSTTLTNNTFGVASSTTSGTSTYFTHDPGGNLNSVLVGSTRYYVFYDGAGSVSGLINSSGTQVASYSYQPYGTTTATGTDASVNPFRFQGGYEDTSGFYKFGTRYENPALGSWTQEDPASLNYLEGYNFDGADPVNLADPSGESIFGDIIAAVAVVALVVTGVGVGAVVGYAGLALVADGAGLGELLAFGASFGTLASFLTAVGLVAACGTSNCTVK
jgi:RHS repeat-associated protein